MTSERPWMSSPIGRLAVVTSDAGIEAIDCDPLPELGADRRPSSRGSRVAPAMSSSAAAALAERALRQLEEYFAGRRRSFDLPLAPVGTDFERRVWQELARIPFGTTRSYGDIARRLGAGGAFRAVGNANRKNPIPIVVPCHRVIGKDGSLTGFALGLGVKRWLLEHEGIESGH